MQIAIGVFPGFAALDAVGPYQVFTQMPDAEVVLCAAAAGLVADDHGLLRVEVTSTFQDVPAPDVLLVPGGLITRRLARDGAAVIDWSVPRTRTRRSRHRCAPGPSCSGRPACWTVCGPQPTGTRTRRSPPTAPSRQNSDKPTEQRVVREGRIWTVAGVSAGIDLALTLVGALAGPDVAQATQLGLEYDPHPPFDTRRAQQGTGGDHRTRASDARRRREPPARPPVRPVSQRPRVWCRQRRKWSR